MTSDKFFNFFRRNSRSKLLLQMDVNEGQCSPGFYNIILLPEKKQTRGKSKTADGRAKGDKGNWFLDEVIELPDQPFSMPSYLWNSSYVNQ